MALGTLLLLRDAGIEGVRGAALQFGTHDLNATTPAGRRIADEFFLRVYLDGVGDRTDPDVGGRCRAGGHRRLAATSGGVERGGADGPRL